MGKHSESAVAVSHRTGGVVSRTGARPVTPRYRSRLRGNIALSLFGFVAAFGIILVNVTDPYAGAVAQPYYQAPIVVSAGDPQVIDSVQADAVAFERDDFTVTEAPKPQPVATTSTSNSGGGGGSYTASAAAVPDPGTAQAIAYEKVMARGWGSGEYDCLVSLWNRESGWRVNALNSSSGAYGIPQSLPGSKMASAGADWETNPATQIEWGLGYITSRYGSPCGAWASSESRGWY